MEDGSISYKNDNKKDDQNNKKRSAFIKLMVGIIFIIVPIGLIVMMSIDLSKAVIASDAEEMKKTAKILK